MKTEINKDSVGKYYHIPPKEFARGDAYLNVLSYDSDDTIIINLVNIGTLDDGTLIMDTRMNGPYPSAIFKEGRFNEISKEEFQKVVKEWSDRFTDNLTK